VVRASWCAPLSLALLVVSLGAAPVRAECPQKHSSYTVACGRTFVLPGWGDADELLGRTPAGSGFGGTWNLGGYPPKTDRTLPV
jgi:hypothetical protein